jgi:hypothetical protein
VSDLLFRAAAETQITIAADPKHLGARIGATAVLRSWGSAMTGNVSGCTKRTMPHGARGSLRTRRWSKPDSNF